MSKHRRLGVNQTKTDSEIKLMIDGGAPYQAAFNAIVDAYAERIYRHILRMVRRPEDADDLTQETFIKIWKALPNFRSESALYTWIYRIATNVSLSHLERAKRLKSISFDEVEHRVNAHAVHHASVDTDQVLRILNDAIEALPDKQRSVFVMRYYDELSYDDISEITGTSVGALKASYHHAVKKVEQFVKQQEL